MSDDRTVLAGTFRHYAQQEFSEHSPIYAQLADFLAERPELTEPLLAAPPGQRRPILYFAAAQYLLRTVAAGHPLGTYLPTIGGTRTLDDGCAAALADLVSTYRAELTGLCATRTTQTNEARRAALLRPGFGRAAATAGHRSLGLVELGTSAGLLLISDRYACRYEGMDGRAATYGPADAELTMTCAVRGDRWPEPAAAELTVSSRVGIDLAPIDAGDPTATDWLRACVWPEQTDRLARLDAALAEVARVRPRQITGHMVDALPAAVDMIDADSVPCVFASNAITYLSAGDRTRLVETLAGIGTRRDLTVVLNEASEAGAEIFLGHRPAEAGPPAVLSVGLLTVIDWRAGRASVEVLARTGPHGQWLEWTARRYAV